MSRPITAAAAALIMLSTLAAGGAPATAATPGPALGPALGRVTAVVETPPLFDDAAGGDADGDDPAIWVDRAAPGRSLVLVTAKNGGLRVYDLRGRQVQSISTPPAPGPDDAPGRFNNVDLVRGFRLGGRAVDLAVVTDRGRDRLRFYRIDGGRRGAPLTDVTAGDVPFAFSADQDEVNAQTTAYGLATFTGEAGAAYAVVSRRSTTAVGLFRLVARGGLVSYHRTATLELPSRFRLPDGTSWSPCADPGDGPQVEGMTVDPASQTLYAAQEDVGLWRIRLDGGRFAGAPRSVERVREFGAPWTYDEQAEECVVDLANDPGFGGRIAADVEGLTILPTGRRAGTLLRLQPGRRHVLHVRPAEQPPARAVRDRGRADHRRRAGVRRRGGHRHPAARFPGRFARRPRRAEHTRTCPATDGEPRGRTPTSNSSTRASYTVNSPRTNSHGRRNRPWRRTARTTLARNGPAWSRTRMSRRHSATRWT